MLDMISFRGGSKPEKVVAPTLTFSIVFENKTLDQTRGRKSYQVRRKKLSFSVWGMA